MLPLKVPISKIPQATAKTGMVKQVINKINTLRKECSVESGTCPLPGTISPGKCLDGSPESGMLGSLSCNHRDAVAKRMEKRDGAGVPLTCAYCLRGAASGMG